MQRQGNFSHAEYAGKIKQTRRDHNRHSPANGTTLSCHDPREPTSFSIGSTLDRGKCGFRRVRRKPVRSLLEFRRDRRCRPPQARPSDPPRRRVWPDAPTRKAKKRGR